MKHYNNDPRWIKAKFNSECYKCHNQIKKGDNIYYRPSGKHVYCKVCGDIENAEFSSMVFDEHVYNNSNGGYDN